MWLEVISFTENSSDNFFYLFFFFSFCLWCTKTGGHCINWTKYCSFEFRSLDRVDFCTRKSWNNSFAFPHQRFTGATHSVMKLPMTGFLVSSKTQWGAGEKEVDYSPICAQGDRKSSPWTRHAMLMGTWEANTWTKSTQHSRERGRQSHPLVKK